MAQGKIYDIDTLLEEVVTLPSMPATLARINRLLDDPASSLSDVSKAILADPAISLKTLRLVNSAFYGLQQRVTSLDHAVSLLGVKVLKNLAMTASLFSAINNAPERFQTHCVATGIVMHIFAEDGKMNHLIEDPGEAFVFGLLHDVGKVILEQYMPSEMALVAETAHVSGTPFYRVEREIIGVDHAAVGARLAHNWKLSEILIHAVAGHHDLSKSGEATRSAAALLAIADFIVISSGYVSSSAPRPVLDAAFWELAGMDSAYAASVVECYFNAQEQIAEMVALGT